MWREGGHQMFMLDTVSVNVMLCGVESWEYPQTEDQMRGGETAVTPAASSWSSCSWDGGDADTSTWQLPASGWRSPDQDRYQVAVMSALKQLWRQMLW